MKLLPRFLRDIIGRKRQEIRHKRKISALDKAVQAFLDSKTVGTLRNNHTLSYDIAINTGGGGQPAHKVPIKKKLERATLQNSSNPESYRLAHPQESAQAKLTGTANPSSSDCLLHSPFSSESLDVSNTESKQLQTKELIISLTSHPKRIALISYTLHSLLTQSHKPHRLILYLSQDEFPNKELDLPPKVQAFRECGLEIAWCQYNVKPYNKLLHALENYPDSLIVTADDDIIYDKDWLKLLYQAYLKEPSFIHCHRAHKVSFNHTGEILPYNEWQDSISYTQTIPSFLNFFTGVGGVLYPPHSLHQDVLNRALFLDLCPTADDIWFFAMALLKGTKINVVENNIPTLNDVDWAGNHDCALYRINLFEGQNDKQLANVLAYYPTLKEKLRFDFDKQGDLL